MQYTCIYTCICIYKCIFLLEGPLGKILVVSILKAERVIKNAPNYSQLFAGLHWLQWPSSIPAEGAGSSLITDILHHFKEQVAVVIDVMRPVGINFTNSGTFMAQSNRKNQTAFYLMCDLICPCQQ